MFKPFEPVEPISPRRGMNLGRRLWILGLVATATNVGLLLAIT